MDLQQENVFTCDSSLFDAFYISIFLFSFNPKVKYLFNRCHKPQNTLFM